MAAADDPSPQRSPRHEGRPEAGRPDRARPSRQLRRSERTTTYVYLTGTLDAATWGAELALGDGPGRIYIVEPTGPIMDDPNLTDKKFPGNPTQSYRSGEPLRVRARPDGRRIHARRSP